MINGGKLYKKLADWYQNNASPLLPQPGVDPEELVDEFMVFWNVRETILLKGFNLQGVPDESIITKPTCHVINLPMIVGLHAGLSHENLIEIAKSHPLDVPALIKTLDEISYTGYQLLLNDNAAIDKMHSNGMKVISEVFPETFSIHLGYMDEMSDINCASLLSDNPEHWPATRLAALMKAFEQCTLQPGQYFDTEFFNINDSLTTNTYLPKNPDGSPDYAVFLERSGMLLPEVARKKIGAIGLWEQMLAVASFDENAAIDDGQGMAGLLNYCINDAPEHLKPTILRAMASMALMSIRGVDDGIGLYKFLREIVDDTWLERLIDSPMLLINMVAEEGNIDLSNNPKSEELVSEFPALTNPETLLDRCLKEIMATAPEELGSSHFRIYLLEELNPPKQVLSPDLQPEQVIKHMLKGLESFSVDEKLEWLRTDDTRDSAVSGCNYVIKTLASHSELDYTAFKGLGSSSVRVLVEAGLDKRKLPRMNGRDKGHLLSEELGL